MKIICVGMNYAPHVRELSHKLPDEPVLFEKPDSALLRNNDPFYIPDFTQNCHYETEIVVRIDKLGRCINRKFAPRYYSSVALGIDFTARDLQQRLASQGLPWLIAKGFDNSAAMSEVVPLAELGGNIQNLHFSLDVDGERRQTGHTAEMIFTVDQIIEYASRFFTFRTGDYIFTGTPAGVGPVAIGNRLEAYLEGRKMLDFLVK